MNFVEYKIDDLLRQKVCQTGDETALYYREDSYTWRELDLLSDAVAVKLQGEGIVTGDHVGIWSENSAAWVVTFLALQKIGAVTVLMNPSYQPREFAQAVRSGDVSWVCYGNVQALKDDSDFIRKVLHHPDQITVGATDIREKTLKLKEWLQSIPEHTGPVTNEADCHDTACMLYTTGTTNTPKCVLHSHYSLINNAIATEERVGINGEDVVCISQPLFHIFGLISSMIGSLYTGARMCILSQFGSKNILECVQRYRCTILNGVPTNFIRLASTLERDEYDVSSLRLSMIGGATISGTQLDYIREALPSVTFMRNYGLTEGGNLCDTLPTDRNSVVDRSVGKPYEGITVAIMDKETKTILPEGMRGEIVACGYDVMQGYYNPRTIPQPVSAIDEDGWLHTGDLGIMDKDGYVSVVGRSKDIIIRGGENVVPAEVGSEILRYEPVLDAIVLGAPHPVLGEEVVACLMLDAPWEYSEQELRSILSVRLSKYKIPTFFLLYDKFPLKANGKPDMTALKESACDRARELHKDDTRYHYTKK